MEEFKYASDSDEADDTAALPDINAVIDLERSGDINLTGKTLYFVIIEYGPLSIGLSGCRYRGR